MSVFSPYGTAVEENINEQGKFKEAAKTYGNIRCQGFGPDLVPATYGLAECRYALGDVDKAVEMWEAVLKLPASPGRRRVVGA